jgi:hypothetical protein
MDDHPARVSVSVGVRNRTDAIHCNKKRIAGLRNKMLLITVQEGSRYDVFTRMVCDMHLHCGHDRGHVHALLS